MSPSNTTDAAVQHNAGQSRFETTIEGHLAVAEYVLDGERMVFTHTFVPPELRGRGLAEKLVRVGLAEAKAQGRRVVPACSYVAAFIKRNPEFKELLASG